MFSFIDFFEKKTIKRIDRRLKINKFHSHFLFIRLNIFKFFDYKSVIRYKLNVIDFQLNYLNFQN